MVRRSASPDGIPNFCFDALPVATPSRVKGSKEEKSLRVGSFFQTSETGLFAKRSSKRNVKALCQFC
jgi:hypothetical protein